MLAGLIFEMTAIEIIDIGILIKELEEIKF